MQDQEHNDRLYIRYTRKHYAKIGCVALIISTLLYLLLSSWIYSRGLREVARCTDFKTQGDAQIKYLLDPVKYGNLDANHDGIACNNLPSN